MSDLHHIATRFREHTLPGDSRAPSVSLDNLLTLESDEDECKPCLDDEDIDVKPASYFRPVNRPEYSGPEETLRMPTSGNRAPWHQIAMPPSLMQRLMAEERAGVELGKMRIYAQGTPEERRFLIFPRLDGSGKDDVYDVTIQAQPTSEFIVSTRPVKQDPVVGVERIRSSTSTSFTRRNPDQDSLLLSLEDDDKNNAPPPVQHAEFCGSVNLHLRALPISVGNTGRSMNPKAQPRHELMQNRELSTPRHKLHRGLIGLPEGKHSLALPTAAVVKSGPKDKRTRAPRNVVLDMIFDAFNDELKLTFKELLDVTGQPKSYLKSVLSSVAVLRSGTWQLKDEFARPKARLVALVDLPAVPDGIDEEEDEDDMEEVV